MNKQLLQQAIDVLKSYNAQKFRAGQDVVEALTEAIAQPDQSSTEMSHLSWSGYNISGDTKSIKQVKIALHALHALHALGNEEYLRQCIAQPVDSKETK